MVPLEEKYGKSKVDNFHYETMSVLLKLNLMRVKIPIPMNFSSIYDIYTSSTDRTKD